MVLFFSLTYDVLKSEETKVHPLAPPLTNCVTLVNLLYLILDFLIYKMKVVIPILRD